MTPTQKLKKFLSAPADRIFPPQSFPWISFFLFAAANLLLSFFSSSITAELWVAAMGFASLALLSLWHWKKGGQKPPHPLSEELFPPIPGWAWILFAVLALLPRFYKLTTLSQWPLKDEGIFGYYAIRFCQGGSWSLTQGLNNLPTLFTWIQSCFFRLLGPSLFSLWLPPALWSLLLLPCAWFASRKFFNRSLSYLVLALAAFSFWPLFLGRFSTQAIFLVFWECVVLGLLGSYLKASPAEKNKELLILSLAAGIGFYTYLSWPCVMVIVGLALLGKKSEPFPGRLYPLFTYFALSFFISLPLLLSFTTPDKTGYLHHLWAVGPNTHWLSLFNSFRGYGLDLFWGAGHSTFHYGPLWGGFLNPLWGSFFFLGLVALLTRLPSPMSLWFLTSLPLLFLPVIFSNDFEDMRLVQVIPILAAITAMGIQFLFSTIPKGKRILPLCLIFSFSASLDLYRLFVIYPHHWESDPAYYGSHKSREFYKAYSILKPLSVRMGPGLILLNFNPDPYDQTLFTATYAFNAAENHRLDPEKAQWAAVLGNIHEEPVFKKNFPDGDWNWLSEGFGRQDGGFILEIIPLTPKNRTILNRWNKADQSLSPLTDLVMDLGVDPDQSQMMEVLQKAYPSFKGDSLLESRYWRIMALHHCAEGKLPEAIEDYQKAIQRGGPQAHLYNELGCLWYLEKNRTEAEKAFQNALGMKPNLTGAGENLKNLLSANPKGF